MALDSPRRPSPATGWEANTCLLVLMAVSVVVLVVDGIRVLSCSERQLLASFPADDAFYYFQLAENFPRPEFNQGEPTTGFHPLYWVVIAPIFALWDGTPAVRATLVLIAAFHVVASYLLFRLLSRRWTPFVGLAVAAFYLVNIQVRSLMLIGVETVIVVIAVLVVLNLINDASTDDAGTPHLRTSRQLFLIGAATGATFLARTDSVLVTGPLLVTFLVTNRNMIRTRQAFASLLGAALVTAPWLAYLATQGSLASQDSARALRLIREHGPPTWNRLVDMARYVVSHTYWLVRFDNAEPHRGRLVLVALAVVACLGMSLVLRGKRWTAWELVLSSTVGVIYVVYGAYLGGAREWYAVYLVLAVFVVVVPPLLAPLLPGVPVRRRSAVLFGVIVFGLGNLVARPFAWYPQEREKLLAAKEVSTLVAAGTLGAFNSGIYSYYLGGRVVNLDGVVNRSVHRALRDRTLCSYLAGRRIHFVMDEDDVLVPWLQKYAPGAEITSTTDLSQRYRTHEDPQMGHRQLLVTVNSSSCAPSR